MSFNRSIRSNASNDGRSSPMFGPSKYETSKNRSASPTLTTSTHHSPYIRQPENNKKTSPRKKFSDEDKKCHKIAFERCADMPAKRSITKKENFVKALSYVGYDLLKTRIDELWTDHECDISFAKFQDILNEEQPVDERILNEAFETLYGGKKTSPNTVEFNEFYTDMTKEGDRLSEAEFNQLRLLLGTERGKIDFKQLIRRIETNKIKCKETIELESRNQTATEKEQLSHRPNSPRSNTSNNNVRISIRSSLKGPNISQEAERHHKKGAFFCEIPYEESDPVYFSVTYSFEIKHPKPIWIVLEPKISNYHKDATFQNLDVRILLFQKMSHSEQRKLIHISTERSGNKTILVLNEIGRGSYEIVPVTFGGLLKPSPEETNNLKAKTRLREKSKANSFMMSPDYKNALKYIFDVFDFDENRQLDRQEYNLWTIRTTGESITNADWTSIKESVDLDVDENISVEKFLRLNDYEVQDQDTKEEDLWNGLISVGFNKNFEIDKMCQFNLTVHLDESDFHLKPMELVQLTEIEPHLLKFLQGKGEKIKINDSSVQLYNYQDSCGSILFAKNESSMPIRLTIQVSKSENAALSLVEYQRRLNFINIERNKSKIVCFAHKIRTNESMELIANIETK